MKPLKQHEFKSGMKVLFEYDGKTHEGIVEVDGKMIFICQDVVGGATCANKHGKKYSYALCDFDGDRFLSGDYGCLKNIRRKPAKKSVKESINHEKKHIAPIVYGNEKLKVNSNECIHAPTYEDRLAYRTKMHELGENWANGISYRDIDEDKHEYNTVYYPIGNRFGNIEWCKDNAAGVKIITVSEWLARFGKAKPVKKYNFTTSHKLNGVDFDITAHREKIAKLAAELKEARAIEKEYAKQVGGRK